MKHFTHFTLSFLCIVVLAFTVEAQGKKVTLVEQVTSATCGPCAAQNPAFNVMLEANGDDVAVIKYQRGSLPLGTGYLDDMFNFNPGDVNNRVVNYYGVTSFPQTWMNGTYYGTPSAITQADIDAENANTQGFEIELTQLMSADNNYFVVNGKATALQNFQTADDASLRLFVAIVEEDIVYPASNPPGLNGELEFYMVMRQMLPDANGQLIGMQLNGDETPINFAYAVDHAILDATELRAVAFIQNMNTGIVHQAFQSNYTVSSVSNIDLGLGNFSIYPNPAQNTTNVSFELAEDENLSISVINQVGQTVLTLDEQVYNAGSHSIDIQTNALSSGVYHVVVQNDNGIAQQRLVIAK